MPFSKMLKIEFNACARTLKIGDGFENNLDYLIFTRTWLNTKKFIQNISPFLIA